MMRLLDHVFDLGPALVLFALLVSAPAPLMVVL
jgi:hypothetical protein